MYIKKSHFFVLRRRATYQTCHNRGVRSHVYLLTSSAPTSSFAATSYCKFIGKFQRRGCMLITWFSVQQQRLNEKHKISIDMHKCCEFR